MTSKLLDYFIYQPSRIVSLGQATYCAGFLAIFTGLVGRVVTLGTVAVLALGGRANVESRLADLYPALPTWWIPESAFGYAVATVVVLLGITVTLTARRVQPFLG